MEGRISKSWKLASSSSQARGMGGARKKLGSEGYEFSQPLQNVLRKFWALRN